jgi:hypothetical protein
LDPGGEIKAAVFKLQAPTSREAPNFKLQGGGSFLTDRWGAGKSDNPPVANRAVRHLAKLFGVVTNLDQDLTSKKKRAGPGLKFGAWNFSGAWMLVLGAFYAGGTNLAYQNELWEKTISPCSTFRSNRDKWGMGVRHALFP